MKSPSHEQLIIEGIRGLPEDLLSEIADFVYFLRKRKVDPAGFEDERWKALVSASLTQLGEAEARHLDEEFDGYDERYPRE